MGCDIHAFVEVRRIDDPEWILMGELDIDRWYGLFGRLAGVRGCEYDPITDPRGLPKDISKATRLFYEWWDGSAHTPSWLSQEEWLQVEKEFDHRWLRHSNVGQISTDMEIIDELRVVFWFDS